MVVQRDGLGLRQQRTALCQIELDARLVEQLFVSGVAVVTIIVGVSGTQQIKEIRRIIVIGAPGGIGDVEIAGLDAVVEDRRIQLQDLRIDVNLFPHLRRPARAAVVAAERMISDVRNRLSGP